MPRVMFFLFAGGVCVYCGYLLAEMLRDGSIRDALRPKDDKTPGTPSWVITVLHTLVGFAVIGFLWGVLYGSYSFWYYLLPNHSYAAIPATILTFVAPYVAHKIGRKVLA